MKIYYEIINYENFHTFVNITRSPLECHKQVIKVTTTSSARQELCKDQVETAFCKLVNTIMENLIIHLTMTG
jgi:hypothetical protein